LEINYPEPYCEHSPTRRHYYKNLAGSIWRCVYCWAAIWQPLDLESTRILSLDVKRIGLQKAYAKALLHRPKITKLLGKLEQIRLLREALPEEELLIVIAAVITDKDFEVAFLEESLKGRSKLPREILQE